MSKKYIEVELIDIGPNYVKDYQGKTEKDGVRVELEVDGNRLDKTFEDHYNDLNEYCDENDVAIIPDFMEQVENAVNNQDYTKLPFHQSEILYEDVSDYPFDKDMAIMYSKNTLETEIRVSSMELVEPSINMQGELDYKAIGLYCDAVNRLDTTEVIDKSELIHDMKELSEFGDKVQKKDFIVSNYYELHMIMDKPEFKKALQESEEKLKIDNNLESINLSIETIEDGFEITINDIEGKYLNSGEYSTVEDVFEAIETIKSNTTVNEIQFDYVEATIDCTQNQYGEIDITMNLESEYCDRNESYSFDSFSSLESKIDDLKDELNHGFVITNEKEYTINKISIENGIGAEPSELLFNDVDNEFEEPIYDMSNAREAAKSKQVEKQIDFDKYL